LQTGQFASAPDAVRLIVAKEGFKGLYVVYYAQFSNLRSAIPVFILSYMVFAYKLLLGDNILYRTMHDAVNL